MGFLDTSLSQFHRLVLHNQSTKYNDGFISNNENETIPYNKGKDQESINQVPHLTLDTIWESDKNTRKHYIPEIQEVSAFLAGNHKATWNRHDSVIKKPRNMNN